MTVYTAPSRNLAMTNETGRDWESLQFQVIFALSFGFYLVTAVAARFTPHFWHNATAKRRSIFAEAKQAAGTAAQIAFYG